MGPLRTALDPPQATSPKGAPSARATWKPAKATQNSAAPRADQRPISIVIGGPPSARLTRRPGGTLGDGAERLVQQGLQARRVGMGLRRQPDGEGGGGARHDQEQSPAIHERLNSPAPRHVAWARK